MKKILFLALTLSLFSLSWGQKTYVMHYLPILTEEQVNLYRGYDMIIVDHEVINNSPQNLKLMREQNPELIILVYSQKMQWHDPMYPDKPWSLRIIRDFEKTYHWFLRDAAGNKLVFWPGTKMMNLRLDCPKYNIRGKDYTYIEYYTQEYIKNVIDKYQENGIKLNGVLDDDLMQVIDFIATYGNNKGLANQGELVELNRQWRLGNAYFLQAIRDKMGSDFLIIGNGGHGYYLDYCNGKQMEHFPEIYIGNWLNNMNNASGMEIALFNARAGEEDNWFFTLCSSILLDNTWFSYGQNTPYESKYNLKLGKPKGAFFQNDDGSFSRIFENGTVTVNYLAERAWLIK